MEDFLSGFKVGLIAIFLVPGYIFVAVVERHLLREKKSQFEKTFEITLISAILWMLAGVLPFWAPFGESRDEVYKVIIDLFKSESPKIAWLFKKRETFIIDFCKYFLSLCLWSFVTANFWGLIRKSGRVDAIMNLVTGRDWYPNVSFQFYKENLDKMIEFKIEDRRYIGVLFKAPDTVDDNYIIVKNLHEIIPVKRRGKAVPDKWEIQPLSLVNQMVLKLSEVKEIKSYKETVLTPTKTEKIWALLAKLLKFWTKI